MVIGDMITINTSKILRFFVWASIVFFTCLIALLNINFVVPNLNETETTVGYVAEMKIDSLTVDSPKILAIPDSISMQPIYFGRCMRKFKSPTTKKRAK